MQMDEKTLEDLAVEEILKELKRGAERAKEHGALGWQKNPAPPPNKRFLRNMLVSTLRDNRPFKRRPRGHSQPDSSHNDPAPGRSTESETFFRYNDRYRKKQDTVDSASDLSDIDRDCKEQGTVDNGNDLRKDSWSDLVRCRGDSFASSQHESVCSGKRHECSPKTVEKEIDICGFDERSQSCKKRLRSSSSDSDVEINEEKKDRKKRKKKHHKKTSVKDDTHSYEKRKHKKSKKSKRHTSKSSDHSSKRRS